MLRLAIVAAGVMAVAPAAWAQQDPEPEREQKANEPLEDLKEPIELPERIELRWEPKVDAKVRAGAGAVSGSTINPGRSALSIIEGAAKGRITRGRLTLEAPLVMSHRQTFGGPSLSNSHLDGRAIATWRFTPRVRLSGELGLSGEWKPDWQDPFQVDPETGLLGKTDRYSHWDRRAGLEAVIRPIRRQRFRISYDYTLSVYKHDPMFDAIYNPIHLTPWDRDTHRLDAVWRIRRDKLKFRVGLELTRRKYFYVFAGDSRTGITHAGPGGEPPNPLLELRAASPRLEADYEIHPAVLVSARYEVEAQRDMFHSYLSFVGHHPELIVSWALPRDSELTANLEAYWRTYGTNSYDYAMDEDPNHPPLAWGDRRSERIYNLDLQYRFPVVRHWAAVSVAQISRRSTNYAYSIDWNYVNWLAWAGAEYRY